MSGEGVIPSNSDPLLTLQLQFNDLDKRVTALEEGLDGAAKERITVLQGLEETKTQNELILEQNAKILTWVEGTDKVLGFARKHWRSIVHVGAGIMSVYAYQNPSVQRFATTILHIIS